MLEFSGAFLIAGGVVAADPTDPDSIINGTDATACEFPAAVSLQRNGSHLCTGSLVHPRVVMLAGHCVEGAPLLQAVFGENGFSPEFSIDIASCQRHPQFDDSRYFVQYDLGFCTLTEDAPAVPIVPPLMGCEAEQLTEGADVVLAGYGFYDEFSASGDGIKRWTTNTIEGVDLENNDLYLLGVDGSSACVGDSGGPAYMQLADGSWRVVGVTSQAHPEAPGPLFCGYGAVYDLVHLEMTWFEEASGYDLTPCFDPDGTWTADATCGGFPTSLTTPGLSWGRACVGADVSGFSAACGQAFEPAGSTGGSDTTGEGSSTSADETAGGGTTGDGMSAGETAATTSGAETTSESPEATGSGAAGGCGCRLQKPLPRGLALPAVMLLGLRRRRTR